jgi:uncharacterized protein YaeQ
MALPSKLYRFKIELSNLDKNSYHSLDFRLAQHPSENLEYLLTRVTAYALNFEESLEISAAGLADPDSPAMSIANPYGGYRLWIEIGNPSNRKIHKASKSADTVLIFTYKDPQVLLNEMAKEEIFRKDEVQIFSIPLGFLARLQQQIEKDNRWNLVFHDGALTISGETFSEDCEIGRHSAKQ